eukprot:768056-Hanusia_phi.AAC.9
MQFDASVVRGLAYYTVESSVPSAVEDDTIGCYLSMDPNRRQEERYEQGRGGSRQQKRQGRELGGEEDESLK